MENQPIQQEESPSGRRIMERMTERDLDIGGVLVEVTGSQGSGKTSVLLSLMKTAILNNTCERNFWASTFNAPLQFVKIGEGKYQILVQEGSDVTFHDRNRRLKQVYPDVTTFADFDDLYEKSIPGKCNAVFFKDRYTWMEFMHYLLSVGEWCNVFIDELGDIAPSYPRKDLWERVQEFADTMKEVRKCQLNVYYNTQSTSDIDYRVRNKVMINIYLPGARVMQQRKVKQPAVNNLKFNRIHGNTAWLDDGCFFGKVTFRDIFKPIRNIQWEARTNGGKHETETNVHDEQT